VALVVPLRYESSEDVRTRLNASVVFYNNKPVYLYNRDERLDLCIFARFILQPEEPKFIIHSSDELLDVSAKPLGWINFQDSCLFAVRRPVRKPLQGIGSANTKVYFFPEEGSSRLSEEVLLSADFGKMLLGIYPSMDQAILISKNNGSCAFSRNFAIFLRNDLKLLAYKKNCIGVFNNRHDSFAIPQSARHYIPMLEDENIPHFLGEE